MTKRAKTRNDDRDDRKRNRDGWKAQLKRARRDKAKRRATERGWS